MDAKFSSKKSLGLAALSGKGMLWLVSSGVFASSVVLDAAAGRLGLLQSLALPLALAWAIAAITGVVVLPVLKALKTGQFIREEGPQAHLKKAGTPTMGGIFFIPVGELVALV